MFTTWTGTNAVTYDLNFELLVGWGDVTSREQLATFMSVFQGMGSHQTKSSTEAGLPPPTTRLVISRFVNMTGWLDQVTVEGFGPWGTQFIGGERTLLPTRCRFTGNFIMVPGINIESKAGGDILIQGNNHQLSSAVVRKNFYILGE